MNHNMGLDTCAAPDWKVANSRNVTLSENIDQRIAQAREQIERLERVKELLAQPGGILNVPIEDLRYAMVY